NPPAARYHGASETRATTNRSVGGGADMTTQWHPIFANLLRPLLEQYYEVRTNLPVGDLPRLADIVLLRRTLTDAPFAGLWRWPHEPHEQERSAALALRVAASPKHPPF